MGLNLRKEVRKEVRDGISCSGLRWGWVSAKLEQETGLLFDTVQLSIM